MFNPFRVVVLLISLSVCYHPRLFKLNPLASLTVGSGFSKSKSPKNLNMNRRSAKPIASGFTGSIGINITRNPEVGTTIFKKTKQSLNIIEK